MILRHPITKREVHAQAIEWVGNSAYYKCSSSELEWLYPQPPNVPIFQDFSKYSDFMLGHVNGHPARNRLATNELAALNWLKNNVSSKASIIELFAESGRFGWHLRDQGYDVRLADPLSAHVDVLNKHGFVSSKSLMPDELPPDWPEPEAVMILESIVRLPDPKAFIESLRKHYPHAKIYITAPNYRRPLKFDIAEYRAGYPPDFMTRWTTDALKSLLAESGYFAVGKPIWSLPITASSHHTWRWKLFRHLFRLLLRINGELEFSHSAWGIPISKVKW